MVHKSDISWTAKVNNPSDLYKKGDDVEAIILSIDHDEKKVSLGVKQLWDDPWPTIFSELPPGKVVKCKVLSVVDYGVFVQVRDGVEGLIPQNELVLSKDEDGEEKPLRTSATSSRPRSPTSTRRSAPHAVDARRRGGGDAAAPPARPKPPRGCPRLRRRPPRPRPRRAAPSESSSSRSSASKLAGRSRAEKASKGDEEATRRVREGLRRSSHVRTALGSLADGVHPRPQGGACIFCDFAAAPPARIARSWCCWCSRTPSSA